MSARAILALFLAVIPGLAAPALAGETRVPEPRFFVMGSGTLELVRRDTGERVRVRYIQPDGRYDYVGIGEIQRLLRSKGGGAQRELTPRFVELLAHVSDRVGQPLVVLSGYRTPAYNEGIRRRGGKAASGSLHTEGLAADLAIPRAQLLPMWTYLRGLECCGAGYYARQGFLHVDVGKPRFWEAATSRTDEDLSGGNARVFARTDFDRYVASEMPLVRFHAVTEPPIRVERMARLVPLGGGAAVPVALEDLSGAAGAGCFEVDADTRLMVKGLPRTARGRVELTTCAPRVGRTPERVETNPIAVR
jgi:uncharacterized protein YcbK (DUF882 family)